MCIRDRFNTQRLSCLVGNILLLSKLENQNIPMKKTKYRLDEQIRQALLSLESKWTQKEIGFQVEMEAVKYVGKMCIRDRQNYLFLSRVFQRQ